jgi:inorganic pyrophosphatase
MIGDSFPAYEKDPGEPWERNDRVITVPVDEKRWEDATRLEKRIQRELEAFFVIVTTMTGKKVRVEGWEGPKPAKSVVKAALKRHEKGKRR